MRTILRSIPAVLLLTCSGSAWAQSGGFSAGFWFSAGESLMNAGLGTDQPCTTTGPLICEAGATSNDIELTNGFRFSLRIDLNQGEHFGHEVQYAYNRTALKYTNPADAGTPTQGFAVHQFGYNFLYFFTKDDNRVRPFVTGGVGGNNFVPPGSSAASGGGTTKFGFNYGAGVMAKVWGPWGIRVDVRQYTSPKPFGLPLASGWLRQEEISAGVGYTF
jgi:opacity protein-like surface antigen